MNEALDRGVNLPTDPDGHRYVERVFERAANGDIDALYEMGMLYDLGDHLPMDAGKASRIFKEAADKGHSHSMWLHACELLWGLGTYPQNVDEGLRYLGAAIEGGSGEACITRARLHRFGELGVSKDVEESERLRKLAKELDSSIRDPLSDPEYVARIYEAIDSEVT